MVGLLEDDSSKVRMAAVVALRQVRADPDAAVPRLANLLQDRDPENALRATAHGAIQFHDAQVLVPDYWLRIEHLKRVAIEFTR